MVNIAFVVGVLSNIIETINGDLGLGDVTAAINNATGNLLPKIAYLTKGSFKILIL